MSHRLQLVIDDELSSNFSQCKMPGLCSKTLTWGTIIANPNRYVN